MPRHHRQFTDRMPLPATMAQVCDYVLVPYRWWRWGRHSRVRSMTHPTPLQRLYAPPDGDAPEAESGVDGDNEASEIEAPTPVATPVITTGPPAVPKGMRMLRGRRGEVPLSSAVCVLQGHIRTFVGVVVYSFTFCVHILTLADVLLESCAMLNRSGVCGSCCPRPALTPSPIACVPLCSACACVCNQRVPGPVPPRRRSPRWLARARAKARRWRPLRGWMYWTEV